MCIDVEEVGDKTLNAEHKGKKIPAHDTLNNELHEQKKGEKK